MLIPYTRDYEKQMRGFYRTLSEKDRRRYAALEARKLPYGGISYLAELFGCDRKTIGRGLAELEELEQATPGDRIRKVGGGRKAALETIEGIDEVFLMVLEDYTAGDPMQEQIRWTNLTYQEIIDHMRVEGIRVSKPVVKQLLKKHGYVKRKAQRRLSTGEHKDRDQQFTHITSLKEQYEQAGNPIISVDTKKKELIGNLYRDGKLYTQEELAVLDHDYTYLAEGIAIPHAIYDVQKNCAYVNIGTSKDTSEFACDSIRRWWYNRGKYDYPDANSILMLVDSGGSNSYRHYIFKEDLQKLVDTLGIEIHVTHYPPYASKWNPVEHRLFPHITRSLKGVILRSHEMVKELIEKTKTKTGLRVKANIIDKVYETGRKYSEDFKETMSIVFDEVLPDWNYRAIPSNV